MEIRLLCYIICCVQGLLLFRNCFSGRWCLHTEKLDAGASAGGIIASANPVLSTQTDIPTHFNNKKNLLWRSFKVFFFFVSFKIYTFIFFLQLLITLLTMRDDTAVVSLHNLKQKWFVVGFGFFFLLLIVFFFFIGERGDRTKKSSSGQTTCEFC